jgi:biofilm PGA synthesis N-glycosyltransferase PgaC
VTVVSDPVRAVVGGTCVALAWSSAGLVGWAFVGYPAFAAAQARMRPRSVRADQGWTPTVSVVVAAHNEAEVIIDKLASVLAADYPPDRLEVLVVDDGSTDGTGDLVETADLPGVRLLRQPARAGKPSALNRGITEATGELVVISDASALFDVAALRNAVRLFADDEVGVVTGAIQVVDEETGVARPAGLYWRLQQQLARWESTSGSTVGVNGNFFAFRRRTFTPLPPDTINDEFTIAMAQAGDGRRVLVGDGVITLDRAAGSMSAEYARRARITAGRFQWAASATGRRHPLLFRLASHKLSRIAVPPAFVVLLASSLAGVAARRPAGRSRLADVALLRGAGAWTWVGAQALFWGAGAAGVALERAGARVPGVLRVPAYLASTTVAGLAGLQRHLTRRQSVLWTTRAEHSSTTPIAPAPQPAGERR